MRRYRSGSLAGDVFGPGTDLVISLFAIMTCVFAFVVAKNFILEGEIRDIAGEIAISRRALLNLRAVEKELEAVRTELADTQQKLAEARLALKRSVDRSESERQADAAKARIKALETELAVTGAELVAARRLLQKSVDKKELAAANDRIQELLRIIARMRRPPPQQNPAGAPSEAKLCQELMALRGKLNRVVFVVDSSGSMMDSSGALNIQASQLPNNQTAHWGRWDDTSELIDQWLKHLPVQNAALIVFSTKVSPFPLSGYLRVDREHQTNRNRFTQELSRVHPSGKTNTLDAIKAAYAYNDVDTILLFTDGEPTGATQDIFDFVSQQKKAGRTVVINTIGLGNYRDKRETFDFLMRLAELTGGSYRAR